MTGMGEPESADAPAQFWRAEKQYWRPEKQQRCAQDKQQQPVRHRQKLARSNMTDSQPTHIETTERAQAAKALTRPRQSTWEPSARPQPAVLACLPTAAARTVPEAFFQRKAEEMRVHLLVDDGPLAMKPANIGAFLDAVTQTYELMSTAFAESTQKQDKGSRWQWWCLLCADEAYGTSPIRPYWDSRASAAEAARERFLYASAVPWILARMKPGPGRKVPKPSSAVNVLRGVRRILVAMDYEPPKMTVVNLVLRGILNRYQEVHGPEALEVKRTEPIPHRAQLGLVRLVRHTNGVKLLGKQTDGATSLFWRSVVAMACLHGQSGQGI
jgi:hypothetical protein